MNRVPLVLVTLAAVRLLSPDFPFGTVTVNLANVLLHRLRAQLRHVDGPTLGRRAPPSDDLSGGGPTTYSSFNYETLAMFDQGRPTFAVVDSLADGARLRDRSPTGTG